MTAARRLAAILAVDVAGYSRMMGEDEAGTAKAVQEVREPAHPITLNANYGFPPTATSTVTIFNDRFTSTPAVHINVDPRCSIPLDECSMDRIGLHGAARPCRYLQSTEKAAASTFAMSASTPSLSPPRRPWPR